MVIIAAAILAGCGDEQIPTGSETTGDRVGQEDGRPPPTDSAEVRVTPSDLGQGDEFSVSFPAGTTRGTSWLLERQLGDGTWGVVNILLIGTEEREPSWAEPDDNAGLADIALDDPGPDNLILPDNVPPGTYRVAQYAEGDPLRLESSPFTIRKSD